MRIDRIQVGAFGRLEDLDTGPDPLEGLVVVLGPNEAGKSTLFSFLTTALYGFQPASRERNPHVPWGSDQATGLVRVRLESDGCAEVERTLRSSPVGRLTLAGRTTELRNQPVPWVGHVPRTVFRQVFAITLGELASLDEETWARIQDRMIGSMGAADLESPRVVAEVLEREAGEIWRPNRRGNQRLRELQARFRELRATRTEALERDRRIRRLVEEGEAVRAELHLLRELRHRDRAAVERVQTLLPVKRQLDRIAALRAEGGTADELRDLPSDPAARLTDLEGEHERLEQRGLALARDLAEREDVLARAESTTGVLAHRERIVNFAARAAGFEHDRTKALELESEIDQVEARLDGAAEAVLTRPWREIDGKALASVPVDTIKERVSRARAAVATSDTRSTAAEPAAWAVLLAGAGLLAWGLVSGQAVLTALGAAALAAGTTWLVGMRSSGGVRTGATAPTSVTDLLHGLPVRPELARQPSGALVSGLERLRDLTLRREELVRAAGALRDRMAEVAAAGEELAAALGRDASEDVGGLARRLDHELREAERLRDAATAAERDAARLRQENAELAERATRNREEIDALSRRVASFASGDVARGLEVVSGRLAALDRADQIEDELVRTHPDLQALSEQIAELDRDGSGWAADSGETASARARIEEHDTRIEELLARAEALEAEVGHLRASDTVDAVDSEIASLKETEAELVRERDRKWVLAKLLREADRRFREEHQPDLLRRAGSYLGHLTAGRYDRLVVDETHEDHLFHLVGPELPAPVPLAPPMSTGTLEQAYLSLRLAIVDHLDQGGERLPLFVDEILVNWDLERRTRGIDVLAGIAATRQVFVFTCHESVAAELSERGARVLELERR